MPVPPSGIARKDAMYYVLQALECTVAPTPLLDPFWVMGAKWRGTLRIAPKRGNAEMAHSGACKT